MTRLDVVVPIYREARGIDAFHARLTRALPSGPDVGIVYVLDPSPDESEARLAAIAAADARVRVLVMLRRFGHQAALLAGLETSRADAVITLDGDGQHPPEAIEAFLAAHRAGADVVQGVRAHTAYAPWARRLTSRWFYPAYRRLTGLDLAGAADYRLLSRRAIDALAAYPERTLFLRGWIAHLALPSATVAYHAEPRRTGRSHFGGGRRIALAIAGAVAFSRAPLRAATLLGAAAAIVAAIAAVIQLATYLSSGERVPGWASLYVLVTFLAGVQLLVLGVIGEYVGAVLDEVKGRPRYLISHTYVGAVRR